MSERERKKDKDTAFCERLSDQKVEQIQLARQALKDRIDEFNRDRPSISSLEIVARARKHSVANGLLCSLSSPDAWADTKQGGAVRQSLKDVWGKHGKCDSIKAYFGNSLVTEIEDFLNMIQTKTAVTAARGPKAKRRNN